MTIEATLERIAVALEKIAGSRTLQRLLERALVEDTEAMLNRPAPLRNGDDVTAAYVEGQPPTLSLPDPPSYDSTLDAIVEHAQKLKPAPQTIAPAGTEMGAFAIASAGWPAYATKARLLANDPQFQNWAIGMAGKHYADVTDSVAFALQFICNGVGAKAPADFSKPEVVDAFIALQRDFEATHAA